MQFDKNIPIYIQIEEYIQDKILHQIWKSNERIPSVRELAISLEVNPNTIMRAYEGLEREGIIFNQRGIGFFVSENAFNHITKRNQSAFYDRLPQFFESMIAYGIPMEEIEKKWMDFKSKYNYNERK